MLKNKDMKQERKVFHLYNKRTKENSYFGSLKALFDNTDHEVIGTPSYTYFVKLLSNKDVYENENMKIIKSVLITTPKKKCFNSTQYD